MCRSGETKIAQDISSSAHLDGRIDSPDVCQSRQEARIDKTSKFNSRPHRSSTTRHWTIRETVQCAECWLVADLGRAIYRFTTNFISYRRPRDISDRSCPRPDSENDLICNGRPDDSLAEFRLLTDTLVVLTILPRISRRLRTEELWASSSSSRISSRRRAVSTANPAIRVDSCGTIVSSLEMRSLSLPPFLYRLNILPCAHQFKAYILFLNTYQRFNASRLVLSLDFTIFAVVSSITLIPRFQASQCDSSHWPLLPLQHSP